MWYAHGARNPWWRRGYTPRSKNGKGNLMKKALIVMGTILGIALMVYTMIQMYRMAMYTVWIESITDFTY